MLYIGFEKLQKYLFAGLIAYAISLFLLTTDAYAVVFEGLTESGKTIFNGMQQIIFAAAGFGIIAVALGAVFGALNWKWLSVIIIGVVVIAGTAGLLKYLTAGTGADVSVEGISYTLQ